MELCFVFLSGGWNFDSCWDSPIYEHTQSAKGPTGPSARRPVPPTALSDALLRPFAQRLHSLPVAPKAQAIRSPSAPVTRAPPGSRKYASVPPAREGIRAGCWVASHDAASPQVRRRPLRQRGSRRKLLNPSVAHGNLALTLDLALDFA